MKEIIKQIGIVLLIPIGIMMFICYLGLIIKFGYWFFSLLNI